MTTREKMARWFAEWSSAHATWEQNPDDLKEWYLEKADDLLSLMDRSPAGEPDGYVNHRAIIALNRDEDAPVSMTVSKKRGTVFNIPFYLHPGGEQKERDHLAMEKLRERKAHWTYAFGILKAWDPHDEPAVNDPADAILGEQNGGQDED